MTVRTLKDPTPIRSSPSFVTPFATVPIGTEGAEGPTTNGFVYVGFPGVAGWVWNTNLAPVVAPPPPPPPISTGLQRFPLNRSQLVTLDAQFQRDRYNRFQTALCLTSSAINLRFSCTNLYNGGGAVPFAYPEYRWVINGTEVATCKPAPGSNTATFVGTLPPMADSATAVSWIRAYDTTGPVADYPQQLESYPRFGISIDINGGAKNDPNVLVQNGSYKWSKDDEVGVCSSDYIILPKTAFKDFPRPLPPRLTVQPMPEAKRYDDPTAPRIARVALVPSTDVQCLDRHQPVVTNRGITVTENEQGYGPSKMFYLFPNLPLYDGPRGVCTTPYTLAIKCGRNGKFYLISPWSLAVIDSTGYKRTLFGLRHKPGQATYWQTPVTSLADPRIECIGNGVDYPLEAWGLAWDHDSLALDFNAPLIGGEEPHVGLGPVAYMTDRRGIIWKLQFNGHDRTVPPVITKFVTGLADPFGIVSRGRSLYVSERGRHAISEWDMDTGMHMRDVVSAAGSQVGFMGAIPTRRWNWRAGQTNGIPEARQYTCVAPEGLAIMDEWLYDGSMAQGWVNRTNLDTGVREYGKARPTINTTSVGSYFVNVAVSDGTFGPRHSVFTNTFFNAGHGRPEAWRPDGTSWAWGDYCYGVDRGQGARNAWNGGHYPLGLDVFNGRLVSADAGGGLDYYCRADAYDPVIDYARMEKGWKEYRKRGEDIRHGPYLVNRTTEPLPSDGGDMDYWIGVVSK